MMKRILAFFGIIVDRTEKHPVHLTGLFFVWIGGFFLALLAAGAGMYATSTQPGFCNSCHIMTPYYQAWKTSAHFGKAVCVDCHTPPAKNLKEHLWHKFQASAQVAKYATRTYSSKPFATVDDASCLRSGCHSLHLLEGRIVTAGSTGSAGGIKFDHRPHLVEARGRRKLSCVSCHSQVLVGTHIEVTYSSCFLCHFRTPSGERTQEPVGGCLGCHELPAKSFQLGKMVYNHKDFVTERGLACKNCHLDVIQGDGKASADRCLACHNQPEKLGRYRETAVLHESHVTKHHVACLHCHDEMRHGLQLEKPTRLNEPPFPPGAPPEPMPVLAFNCSFCHEGKHAGPLEMYSGQAASLGLPSMPSPMFLANVDCIGCHYRETTAAEEQEFRGHTIAASPQACVKCHDPAFEGILKQTSLTLNETLTKLREKRLTLGQGLTTSKKPETEKTPILKQIAEAERLERFVWLSRGEHNIYLAATALRKEDALLTEAAAKAAIPAADLSSLPLLSGGYCATMCHEKLGVKVPPETVTAFGKMMPHLMHTTLLPCVTCHEIGGHKSVPLKADVKETVCVGCHPE